MKLLIPILFMALSLAATPSSTQYVAGERVVVIRIDDIQDYGKQPHFADPEYTVLQYHLDNRIPALLSVVAGNFGTDQKLVNLTSTGVGGGLFEIGIHGWWHVTVVNETETQQTTEMKLGESKLDSIFEIQIRAFVPPGGRYDQATIQAMHATGLTLMSANMVLKGDRPGEIASDGIAYFPETVRTSEVNQTTKDWVPNPMKSMTDQISGSWASYGVAIVVIHPRQFVDLTGKWSNDKWESYVQMIEWIKANQGSFVLPAAPQPANQIKAGSPLNPLAIPVALASGIVTSLLLTIALRARRNRRIMPRLRA